MEATIGFDLRSIVSDPSWTVDRRTRFLLRRDVPSVRSVDPLVWVRPPELPPSPEAEGLWSSLSDLFVAAHALDHAGAVAVRITALGEEGRTPGSLDPTGPAFERCDLLGYDVADCDLLGGLANCGYTPEEAASLAPVWAPLLNEWHLFGNPEDATAYAAVTAKRVPEHTDPERVGSFVYNTATAQGLGWRVPDTPFVMETFCMGDHGIVSGYRAGVAGQAEPVLLSAGNDVAEEAWGLRLYRSTLYAFCAALEGDGSVPGDVVRPLVHQVLDAFWCHPNPAEAHAWGAYPYDSDPAGTAIRPLPRPFAANGRVTRGDRAWLAGSLALSPPEARAAYLRDAPEHELAGAPATDLYERAE